MEVIEDYVNLEDIKVLFSPKKECMTKAKEGQYIEEEQEGNLPPKKELKSHFKEEVSFVECDVTIKEEVGDLDPTSSVFTEFALKRKSPLKSSLVIQTIEGED